MRKISFLPLLISLTFLSSCAQKNPRPEDPVLTSIQVIDRNGFSETISAKERLSRYKKVDFLAPQPYRKVLRVFGKNEEGKSPSSITSYHDNGYIKQYLEVLDGRAQGVYKEWHSNGRLKMELHIIEGMADISDRALSSCVFEGKNTVWDERGSLVAEIFYDKGMLDGEALYYYPSGVIKKRIPYKQDKIEGAVLFYSEEESLLETVSYKEDKPHGFAKSLRSPGSLLYEENWEDGKLIDGKYYDAAGSVLSLVTEGSGKRAEFEEGKLLRLVEYIQGFPEGTVSSFDKQGNLISVYVQKEGKKHGEEKIYYPASSQVKILLSWQEDVLQGPVKTWFPSGAQESEKEMYQNKKNGTSFAWYKNGSVMLAEEYENDLLISGSYYKKGDKKPLSRVINKKGTATLYDADGFFLKKISYEKGLPLLENCDF